MTTFSISQLFKEARRRRVFRVAALYVVGAWVFLQAADLAFPAMRIPEAAIRYVWLGLLLAFPIAIIFGWRYDFVDGRLTRTIVADQEIDLRLKRPDYVILSAFVVVTVAIVVGFGTEIADTQQGQVDAVLSDELDAASIAVLPFINMSPDPDNAFFAEGLSEELLNRLAHIKGLSVISRTSSFSFSGQNVDIRTIGQQLNVANILEGSVRVAGDELKITAQLIDSQTGVHRWSETYDRSMSDIFAIQEDVATEIVLALSDKTGIGRQSVGEAAEPNLEAYELLLRARARTRTMRWFEDDLFKEEIQLLTRSTQLDPDYADAYVALADVYATLEEFYYHSGTSIESQHAKDKARVYARRAIELTPDSSDALRVLAYVTDSKTEQIATLRNAITKNPNSALSRLQLAEVISTQNPEEALRQIRIAHQLDPLNYKITRMFAHVLVLDGQYRKASTFYRLGFEQEGGNDETQERAFIEYLARLKELSTLAPNLNFERGTERWRLGPSCTKEHEFLVPADQSTEIVNGSLRSTVASKVVCAIAHPILATDYAGKYIQLTGRLKSSAESGQSHYFMTLFGDHGSLGFTTGPTVATDTEVYWSNAGNPDWTTVRLRLFAPHDTVVINLGLVSHGQGQVWFDSVEVTAFDNPDFIS